MYAKLFATSIAGTICAATLTGLVGCTSHPTEADAQAKGSVPVRTVVATQADVKRTTLQPATVHAYYRTAIQANVQGYVSELAVDIGDYVEAGQVLAVIAVPELERRRAVLEAKIRRKEAEERQAEAGIQLAQARVRSAREHLKRAQSQLGQAQASLAASEAEFNRTQDLVNRGSLQNRVLDEVLKKRDSERAAQDAAVSAVSASEAEIGVAEAQTSAAQADLQAAQAETQIARRELEELQVMIDYATLRAPFAGVVAERYVELGDLVSEKLLSAGKPLFVLNQVDKVRIRVPVPEDEAPLIQVGDALTVSFPSFSSEPPIETVVSRRSASLDPSTRTMLVEAEWDNSDGKLLPGMFGQASIVMDTKLAANLLPSRAVRFDESGRAYVYIVNQDNTVSVSDVTVGNDDGATIEILGGLEPGQVVVDAHLKRFSDGDKVRPL